MFKAQITHSLACAYDQLICKAGTCSFSLWIQICNDAVLKTRHNK